MSVISSPRRGKLASSLSTASAIRSTRTPDLRAVSRPYGMFSNRASEAHAQGVVTTDGRRRAL